MNLDLPVLQAAYRERRLQPAEVIAWIHQQMDRRGSDPTWITRLPRSEVEARARSLDPAAVNQPLFGVPFAIKDNIDLADVPTTCACPQFAYTPTSSATVVQRLLDAGAIALGKTNLDQFATGLVGVRSPYGVPANPFNHDYIPGGSSSGSAVAVSAGLCTFALGTDTAGSGRVPAAFNNLIGLKPTRGLLSTRGLVPACRTLDCISIFTRRIAEAAAVLAVAAGYDPEDPYSRPAAPPVVEPSWPPRIGVPAAASLSFFGNHEAAELFARARQRWAELGATVVEIDFTPFAEAASLLYAGPWVAERHAAIRSFLREKPDALHPITRQIIDAARHHHTVDAFEAMYRLAELRRKTDRIFESIDALLTPTAGTVYTVRDVEADPVRLNTQLGTYTNFVNLLDLSALAVPAGFLSSGVPWGVTLLAPAFHDDVLLKFGARFLGQEDPPRALRAAGPWAKLAVCGAHLSGLPLNGQLIERGGRLVRVTRTSPHYRLFALPGTTPPKPGLLRVETGGSSIEVEVWELPVAAFGDFVARIPHPLGIGTLSLEDGERVQGFLCEASATQAARDVTTHGGWRAYLRSAQ